jgi:NADH:ubiquinone reductase (H+-translocating)
LRKRILLCFERAELATDPAEHARLMTFVIIGAGPTGVELAGAIAELAKKALAEDFRTIDPGSARIILAEGGPRVLPQFPEDLSETAARSLTKLGVELHTGHMVTAVDEDSVTLAGTRIETGCVVWAAGVAASPAARWLNIPADRAGRALIGAELTAPGHPEIFVVGDSASIPRANGEPLPGLAAVAKQQGIHVARTILGALKGEPRRPFIYKDVGILATIGRQSAVVDFGKLHLTGFIGWLVWSLAHIYFLIGFRNRIAVAIDWLWSYVTFERGARLITGPIEMETPRHAGKKHAA